MDLATLHGAAHLFEYLNYDSLVNIYFVSKDVRRVVSSQDFIKSMIYKWSILTNSKCFFTLLEAIRIVTRYIPPFLEYYSDILTLAAARGDMESIDNILILRPRTRIDDMASIRAAENGYRRTTHKLFQLGLTNYSECAEIAAKNGH